MSIRLSFRELEWKKLVIKSELEKRMSHESIVKAVADHHAKREPRPCGLTIHPGVGCNLQCVYCYVEDMGFNFRSIKPYGLEGNELAYSLLNNPNFFPTIYGTYLAFGSVTEPFHPIVIKKTLTYLITVDNWLGNPCQVSTKFHVDDNIVLKLASLRRATINPLITIVTIKRSKTLEPYAPSPELRLETIRSLRKRGLKPMIFLRPLIPGVNDDEIEDIISLGKEAGAYGVIIGGLRVTIKIMERMKKSNFDVKEIEKRMLAVPRGNRQVSVLIDDLKDKAIEVAREKGLTPFKSACCANTYNLMLQRNLRVPCPSLCFLRGFCTDCPVNCININVKVDEEDVIYAVNKIFKLKPREVDIGKFRIYLYLEGISKSKLRKLNRGLRTLESVFRKDVKVIPE